MTKDRRTEMRHLRELAIQVEKRINARKKPTTQVDAVGPIVNPDTPKIPPEVPDFDCDETATSETLPTDNIIITRPVSTPVTPEETFLDSPPPPPLVPEGPLESPLDSFSSPKLIRSNSYTLDQPSPMLLKFLDSLDGHNSIPAATVVVAKTKQRLNKSASSPPKTPKSPSSPGNNRRNSNNNNNIIHKSSSPKKLTNSNSKLSRIYGIKSSPVRKAKCETLDDTKRRLTIHSRGEKVEKFFMKSKTVEDFQNRTTQQAMMKTNAPLIINVSHTSEESSSPEKCRREFPVPTAVNDVENKENVNGSLVNVLESFDHLQIEVVIDGEQKRLLDQQLNKQKQLLVIHRKLDEMHHIEDNRTSTPVQRTASSMEEDTHSEPEEEEEHKFNETSFYSTIRGESPSPLCSMSLVSDAYSKQYLHSIRSFATSPTITTNPAPVSPRQRENVEIAATIINSHVRGYLIRRLLRTEFVQNIIDNIKNILFRILDANPRDMQLKRTYLMQLNGNCEKLHDVFFQFTTKERMAVINRDRQLLLQRLSQRAKRLAAGTGTNKQLIRK